MVSTTEEGSVEILPIAAGRFRVSVKPHDDRIYVPLRSYETSFPPDLIADLADHSFTGLCETLRRFDDQGYAASLIRQQLLAHFDPAAFHGKRILDFGCGAGASTFCIATLFPDAEIIGVDLDPQRVKMANKVATATGLSNARFLRSPNGSSLPAGIGSFDFVTLSAVYEHLLPKERRQVLPLIWSHMKPGAVLFINQTPFRYFPYEHHTTGLWLINYLPARLCRWLANHHSRINIEENRSRDWKGLLRGGIRGATEPEILRNLRRAGGDPEILEPKDRDRAAYWLSRTSPERHRGMKRIIAVLFRLTDRYLGTIPSMNLDVVIRKRT